MNKDRLKERAAGIRLLLSDVDGVLTDNGVYYSDQGELMKRFSIRDGMGVERLKKLCSIPTGIVTGETSPSVARRAGKLGISECHYGVRDKIARVEDMLQRNGLGWGEIAYIGDDVNDLDVIRKAGLSACPADAMEEVAGQVDYRCVNKGGHGAFREFAELLISLRNDLK